jgi:DNA modification methylase
MKCEIKAGDCERFLEANPKELFDLTFMDPPFNQGKEYRNHNDNLEPSEYWHWMHRICHLVFKHTSDGGAIYFMQREKNAHLVIDALLSSQWTFQNMIIWKKKTSAVPIERAFGKHYQIIVFATKGQKPRTFNKLRIDPPLLETEKYRRPNGMYVTDVWDDIRELTSGYFAGSEPLRSKQGERAHKQQAPTQLLTRIILSSSNVNDTVFDPFAGTGTTLVVARQLRRNSLGIELDPENVSLIDKRLAATRSSDDISKYRDSYLYTEEIDKIWPRQERQTKHAQLALKI